MLSLEFAVRLESPGPNSQINSGPILSIDLATSGLALYRRRTDQHTENTASSIVT
jgi:hypothetical protein